MSSTRKIIKINEDRCTGCRLCIPNCPEGALQIIDGKARLVSDLFCDGLGACIGHCPEGAITVEEREAEPYDESKVMENIVPQGTNTIRAHLRHLRDHGAQDFYDQAVDFLKARGIPIPDAAPPARPAGGGCPGSRVAALRETVPAPAAESSAQQPSQLQNWPVQLMLMPPTAPYLKHADLLIAADCVPFALAGFHQQFLKGRVLIIACPKLDNTEIYLEKLTAMFATQEIRSVRVVHMQVPCCFGLTELVRRARTAAGKVVPVIRTNISLQGEILEECEVA